jgi:hypothetical protein
MQSSSCSSTKWDFHTVLDTKVALFPLLRWKWFFTADFVFVFRPFSPCTHSGRAVYATRSSKAGGAKSVNAHAGGVEGAWAKAAAYSCV